MGLIDRLLRGLSIGKAAVDRSVYLSDGVTKAEDVAMALDTVMANMVDPSSPDKLSDLFEVNKEATNKLDVYSSSTSGASYYAQASLIRQALQVTSNDERELPPYGDPQRDFILDKFVKLEPILAGAVYSMTTKAGSLSWTIMGKKQEVIAQATVLDTAVSMNGNGWGDFISNTAYDFNVLDRGTFWHTPREGSTLVGKLGQLVYMDALNCAMTGNMKKPVYYSSSVVGQSLILSPGEYAHFASMISPREHHFGSGFSPAARAYRSARILFGLSNYDWDKLRNLPPEGVAAVSGLTKDEFLDSLAIWKAARKQNNSLTYPMVLWLLGSQPGTEVGIDFIGFSQIPESFNRKDVVDQYVNILALDFGVDAREFWPVSTSSMGTAAESEIQHMKARGKGPSELITQIERWFSREGIIFSFDTQDVGEDQVAAAIAKGWVDAFMPLYMPGTGTPPSKTPTAPGVTAPEGGASQQNTPKQPTSGGESVITKDNLLRLLIDRRVLPNWLLPDDENIVRTDLGVVQKEWVEGDPNTPVILTYKQGAYSITTHPAYTIIPNLRTTANLTQNGTLPTADALNIITRKISTKEGKQEVPSKPNIRGNPIPDRESLRGSRINSTTIKQQLELWAVTPELSVYAPDTPVEELITTLIDV